MLIDDRDVGTYDARWLKKHVALVSQEPVLYARSVRRNISYGLEEEDGVPPDEVPSTSDVEEAARWVLYMVCAFVHGVWGVCGVLRGECVWCSGGEGGGLDKVP